MQDLSDDERKQVLGEVLMDEFKAIREGIDNLPTRTEFQALDNRVARVESDVKVIKAAVTDQSKQIQVHEIELKRLRHKAA